MIFTLAWAQESNDAKNEFDELRNMIVELQNNFEKDNQTTNARLNEIDEKLNKLDHTKKFDSINEQLDKIQLKLEDSVSSNQIHDLGNQVNELQNSLNLHQNYTSESDTVFLGLGTIQTLTSIAISILMTTVGISAGAYISRKSEKRKLETDTRKAKTNIQKEFERLNQISALAIKDTRNVLSDLVIGNVMITRLANGEQPHNILVPHLHGFVFLLWDATLPNMHGLEINELAKIGQLHQFIEGASVALVQRHAELIEQLEHIRTAPTTRIAIAANARDILIRDFIERMKIYGGIYRRIHELQAPWLKLSKFSEFSNQ